MLFYLFPSQLNFFPNPLFLFFDHLLHLFPFLILHQFNQQPHSHSGRSLHQDLLAPWPEELKGSSLLSGESTHSNFSLAPVLPTLIIGGSAVATSRVLHLQAEVLGSPRSDIPGQTLTFLGVSGPRAIAACALYLRVSKSRDPRLRDVDYLLSRLSLTRYSQDQSLNPLNPETRCPEITLHINHYDSRRARDFRDVGSRVLAPALANLSTPPTRSADMPDLRVE
jgi:hypothetical protein